MTRLLKQLLSSEKGQSLTIVLGLLAIGGLTIAVSLNYATTSLNASRIIEEGVKGVYAADAGVEHALWSLGDGISPPTQLPENINRMAVNIQTEDKGSYTLYLGELYLIKPGAVHVDWLDVHGNIEGESEPYKYTITVTWQAEGGKLIKLIEVGARIPVGYSYQSGSADIFPDNLSTEEPDDPEDADGDYVFNWELPKINISEDDSVKTQTFYITGEGSQKGHYAWVVALSKDIDVVGEITGTLYKITATATRPEDGRTTARIVADVMVGSGMTYIISWQISS